MAHVKIWVHAVWGTKNRSPYLQSTLKKEIINHIKENAIKKKVFIDTIDGYVDHLHCLFELRADLSIADAMKLIKGESSFWVNKNKLADFNFEWANEYYAASIDESELKKIRYYIMNQEKHHGQPFEEKFKSKYKFESPTLKSGVKKD